MLLPLVLASLLSFASDQPIAPVPPGSPTGQVIGTIFIAGDYVVYGESTVNLHRLTPDGTERLASFPGTPDAVTLAGETLLILSHTDAGVSQIAGFHPATGLGPAAFVRAAGAGAAMAASGERIAFFFEAGARIEVRDLQGSVLRTELSVSTADVDDVTIAAGAESFLFAWLEGGRLYTRALILDGLFLTPAVLVAEDARMPALSSDGRRSLVTWQTQDAIAGRTIAQDGQPLGDAFTVAARPTVPSAPAVSWNGSSHTVVFEDENQRVVRVDVTRGGFVGEAAVIASGYAPAAGGSTIAWIERRQCSGAERVMVLQPGREPVLVSTGEPVRFAPQTVAFGNTFATVWLDRTDVLRARLRIGDRIIELSDRAASATPAIATNGDRVLVAWSEYDTVCNQYLATAIVTAEGDIVARRELDNRWIHFAAASNGSDFALIWTENLFNSQMRVIAVQLDADGRVTIFPRVVAQESVSRFSGVVWTDPSLVWAGGEYLAVWQRSGGTGVRLQRLSRTLDPIEGVRTLTDDGVPFPDVAATPDAALIVYNDNGAVRGLVLDRLGALLAAPLIVPENQSVSRPAVAARGAEFVVVAGNEVARVGVDGSIDFMAPLHGDPRSDRAVAASGSRALLVYERGGELYLRTVSFARTRSVRR